MTHHADDNKSHKSDWPAPGGLPPRPMPDLGALPRPPRPRLNRLKVTIFLTVIATLFGFTGYGWWLVVGKLWPL